MNRPALLLLSLALPFVAACTPDPLTDTQKAVVKTLALSSLPPLPADPTNAVADNGDAAALGATFFNDPGFSGNGQVACATCHVAERQFQDDLPLARGAGTTSRRTMPLPGVAWSPFLFWDGRKDSLWSQALGPVESPVEHATTRTDVAHRIAATYRDRFERLFGPMPDLSHLPSSAGPFGTAAEKAAWDAMSAADRLVVDSVYAGFGKAIAAFERSLRFPPTRFDRFAEALAEGRAPGADATLSADEIDGFKLFIGKGQCINCHNGPRFTDDHFHNTGVPQAVGLPVDHGRAEAIAKLDADPFNCLGVHSDGQAADCGELTYMLREGEDLERAFKTPSLRGAATRPPYMHSGQIATLADVIDHYAAAPHAPSGHSELEPVAFTDAEKAALMAFLKTLSE